MGRNLLPSCTLGHDTRYWYVLAVHIHAKSNLTPPFPVFLSPSSSSANLVDIALRRSRFPCPRRYPPPPQAETTRSDAASFPILSPSSHQGRGWVNTPALLRLGDPAGAQCSQRVDGGRVWSRDQGSAWHTGAVSPSSWRKRMLRSSFLEMQVGVVPIGIAWRDWNARFSMTIPHLYAPKTPILP